MSNGQALTARENLAKGARVPVKLREWQRGFVSAFWQKVEPDFLCVALPGGGKTIPALHLGRTFLDNDRNARIIVVVPTDGLRTQWQGEAFEKKDKRGQVVTKFGIRLMAKGFAGFLGPDYDGIVTTYATIANNPELYARLCVKHRVMVVFDEIHHSGTRSHWGRVQRAFEMAARRLCLSGTPFRSKGDRISFLEVMPDGNYKIDYQYDYPTAVRDGVVRTVSFHRYSGGITLNVLGEAPIQLHTEDEDLEEDEERKLLRGLLTSPEYTRGFLRSAHERLLAVRAEKPDAGGLVLCKDGEQVRRIGPMLREITGEEPAIIVSDDETATSTIDEYRKAGHMWIVAIRKVSEGVDIPRLMVLAYLTTTVAPLFFRQAVGRIVRSEGTDFDTEAYCFIPNTATLVKQAEEIEMAQAAGVEDDDDDEPGDGKSRDQKEPKLYSVDSTEAEFAGITMRGVHLGAPMASEIIALSKELGVPEAKVRVILERARQMPIAPVEVAPVMEHPEEVETRLRRQCKKKANQLAARLGIEVKEVHSQWKRYASVGHDRMSIAQFEAKLEWLKKRLAELN